MKIRKTVTEKKRMANRGNAKKAHGPNTERGKKNSRFNAIKGGLFAKFLVLGQVDGDDSGEEFAKLHANLKQEYRPQGPTEAYYLEEMAKSMWRIRRATRYEHGVLQTETRRRDPNRPEGGILYAAPATDKLNILENAQKEIGSTGTLSLAAYQAIMPLLTDAGQEVAPVLGLESGDMARSEDGFRPAVPNIDKQFLRSLNRVASFQDSVVYLHTSLGDDLLDDYIAPRILPSDDQMKKIFGSEKAAQNQFDWALRGLLESKERRKKGKKLSTI